MRLHRFVWTVGVFLVGTIPQISAQTFGIGTDFPIATLDVRTQTPISSLNIERMLTVSAAFNPTILVNDSSDYTVLEMYQLDATNIDVLAYFQNDGLGYGIWSTNPEPANNNPAAYFSHGGVGPGVGVYHAGTADGMNFHLENFFNLQDGIEIWHEGNGYGLFIDAYNATQNILNYVASGTGISNIHFSNSNQSMLIDKGGFVGAGYSGDGYYFTNTDFFTPFSGADGFGFRGYANTQTSTDTVLLTVYGAVLAARQYGVGHGILINHEGSSGRNAEFNVLDPNNTDAAIFAVHMGDGSAIVAQNQDNTITGTIAVADISYTGTDQAHHIGVAGYSSPAGNWGIGVDGYGGYIGVHGAADTAGLAGIYSSGDLGAFGTKAFIIDHPEKPETHLLKHFSIESDEVLNMYKGTAVLERNGRAVVELPSYFDDINRDFAYQLTPIGTPVQPWIVCEITNNRFVIGGKPNSRVSWIIVANRNDAYIKNNPDRITPELAKRSSDVGKYLDPVSHGKTLEEGILYKPEPTMQISAKEAANNMAESRKKLLEAIEVKRHGKLEHQPGNQLKRASSERQGFDRMEIKQEIKTWDELR
ncbi:MAG: hypothetical protein GY751_05935 [Bacteroidetes bacterium]|nr:hypothetical protein [Bacteroidota bacterium]